MARASTTRAATAPADIPAPAPPETMALEAIEPIQRHGQRHEPGAILTAVPVSEAQRLINRHAARPVP